MSMGELKKTFICGGMYKSGTTMLQRILNSHPEISCPAEHNLKGLNNMFSTVNNNYNRHLEYRGSVIGVAALNLGADFFNKTFFEYVREIILFSGEGKKVSGINDNEFFIENLDLFHKYMPETQFILIVRNPLDTALSNWDHCQRLYVKEGNKKYLETISLNNVLDKSLYSIEYSKVWINQMAIFQRVKKELGNKVLIIKFEDFISDKYKTCKELFGFLSVDTSDRVLKDIVSKSSIENMRQESTEPSFYRNGSVNFGHGRLNDTAISKIKKISKNVLSSLGYE